MKQPPRWKTAVLIWIAIYPSITALSFVMRPFLQTLPLPLRTLFLTLVLVPVMVFILVPFLNKIFSGWLSK